MLYNVGREYISLLTEFFLSMSGTVIFKLPEYLQEDIKYIASPIVGKPSKQKVEHLQDTLADEYGGDAPEDFEFVCVFLGDEDDVLFEDDL